MKMQEILNATEVRRDWGRFIDSVVHGKPGIIKRNRDYILSLSIPQAKVLLQNIDFKAYFIQEEDGTITAGLEDIDLLVNQEDEQAARVALAKELIDYADDYFNNFQLYFQSPNRRSHFPHVLAVLLQNSASGVAELIHA
jgi:archaeosine-15-forming tRNA-guanine transglycosylase